MQLTAAASYREELRDAETLEELGILQVGMGEQLGDSNSGWKLHSPAVCAELGKQLPQVRMGRSGDLGRSGVGGCEDGVSGYLGFPPDAPFLGMPGNGYPWNPAKSLPDCAPKVLALMLERASSDDYASSVLLEDGEVWEKSPVSMEMVGSSIRAMYPSHVSVEVFPAQSAPLEGMAET